MHVKCFTSAFLHFLCVVLSFTCAWQTFYLSISAFLMNGLVFYLCMSDGILEHYYISCVSLPEHWCIQLWLSWAWSLTWIVWFTLLEHVYDCLHFTLLEHYILDYCFAFLCLHLNLFTLLLHGFHYLLNIMFWIAHQGLHAFETYLSRFLDVFYMHFIWILYEFFMHFKCILYALFKIHEFHIEISWTFV